MYPEYVAQCDAACFSPGPLTGGEGAAGAVMRTAEGVKQLRKIAGADCPVCAVLDVPAAPADPAVIRAAAWAAIIRRASGLVYRFADAPPDGDHAALRDALAALNGRIADLAPAILADTPLGELAMSMADESACHVKATRHDGAVYVFAQRFAGKGEPARASITVAGARAGMTVEVVGEGRTITAVDGGFSDEFAPLAEHVYRLKP